MIPPDGSTGYSPAADDLALVERIAAGDPLALSALYDRHAQAIYSHALHLLGDVAEAEDAVEETFWRVWRRAGDYDPSLADIATWLLILCRQRATEQLRTKKRAQSQGLDDPTGLGPESDGHSAEAVQGDQARVASALAEIPADQRVVLELAFFRGMSPADVAGLTKQSPETARTRLRVAMRKLRDALPEAGQAPAPERPEAGQ